MQEQKSKYFKMAMAVDEVKNAHGAQKTAISVLKFLGKGAFNVGRFAVAEVLPSTMEKAAKEIEKNPNSNDEQLEKANNLKKKAAEHREMFK